MIFATKRLLCSEDRVRLARLIKTYLRDAHFHDERLIQVCFAEASQDIYSVCTTMVEFTFMAHHRRQTYAGQLAGGGRGSGQVGSGRVYSIQVDLSQSRSRGFLSFGFGVVGFAGVWSLERCGGGGFEVDSGHF